MLGHSEIYKNYKPTDSRMILKPSSVSTKKIKPQHLIVTLPNSKEEAEKPPDLNTRNLLRITERLIFRLFQIFCKFPDNFIHAL